MALAVESEYLTNTIKTHSVIPKYYMWTDGHDDANRSIFVVFSCERTYDGSTVVS
jgi:hypothetical protein